MPLPASSLLLLLACTEAPGPVTDPTGTGSDGGTGGGTDGGTDGGTSTEPVWTAAQAAQAVEDALAAGLADPFLPRQEWISLFDYADEDCPGGGEFVTEYGIPSMMQGCTSQAGCLFAGLASYQEDQGDGRFRFALQSDGYIIDPEGQRLTAAGGVSFEGQRDGEAVYWNAFVAGMWAYPASTGWLAEGASLVLSAVGTDGPDGRWLWLDGGQSLGEHTMYFQDLTLDPTGCGGHPTGAIEVRDPDGAWYRLDFGQACDGCAEVLGPDGQALGSACPALREALSAWSDPFVASAGGAE